MRWSNNGGTGYINDVDGVIANDLTGGSRDLNASPIVSLFLLAR